MKKGISDTHFVPKWDLETFLRSASNTGFDGVELTLKEYEGDFTLQKSSKDIKFISKIAKNHGVEISSITTSLLNKFPLFSDKENRKRGIEIGLKMIEFAAEMDVPIVQIVPGTISSNIPYDQAYFSSQDSLRYLGEEALKRGITIGVENLNNHFLPSPMEFMRYLDEINLSSVRAYFDNGNAIVTGMPEHFINILKDNIVAIHFKDYQKKTGDFVHILQGDMNWNLIMKSLNTISYKEYIITTPPYILQKSIKEIMDFEFYNLLSVLNN